MSESRPIRVVRVTEDGVAEAMDAAAVEEPLEVRLHDRPFAVIMRTPGSDRELAAGFLLAEGVIERASDIGAVEHCRHPDHREAHNVVNVFLMSGARERAGEFMAQRRHVAASAACGICGRTSIESLAVRAEPLSAREKIAADVVRRLPVALREQQSGFERTGGLHAAALFRADGTFAIAAEDVGRHNAVDKVIGRMLLDDRLPLTAHALAVSGRTSFEIVQKAWVAGIELICAVSAPSSLAIDLAETAGITLIGFARDSGFNVYTHSERLG
jgi:FdhD protein